MPLVVLGARIVDRIVEQDRMDHDLRIRDPVVDPCQVAEKSLDMTPVMILPLRLAMARLEHGQQVRIDLFQHGSRVAPPGRHGKKIADPDSNDSQASIRGLCPQKFFH